MACAQKALEVEFLKEWRATEILLSGVCYHSKYAVHTRLKKYLAGGIYHILVSSTDLSSHYSFYILSYLDFLNNLYTNNNYQKRTPKDNINIFPSYINSSNNLYKNSYQSSTWFEIHSSQPFHKAFACMTLYITN